MRRVPFLLIACATLALSHGRATADDATKPLLTIEPSPVVADEQLQWTANLTIANRRGSGLYLDSLVCTAEDLTPGDPALPRVIVDDLHALVAANSSVEANADMQLSYFRPADCDRMRLTFRLHTHSADGTEDVVTAQVETAPGEFQAANPSESVASKSGAVEVVEIAAGGMEKGPGLLLIHPEGSSARRMLRLAQLLAGRGTTVVCMSLPGFGTSAGSRAFAGPAVRAATRAGLDRLAASPHVDPKRMGVLGQSLGAVPALNLAADDPRVSAVALISGAYDLSPSARAAWSPALRTALLAGAGHDTSAWKDASPAARVPAIKARVLVLHGERDRDVPAEEARRFLAALEKAGAPVESKLFPNGIHSLSPSSVLQSLGLFLERALR